MAKTKEPAKAEERTLTTNKIGIKEGLGYMAGDAGNLFVLTYVSSFLKIFYTDVLKIDMNRAKNVFLFPRLWDAINDPIWGALVARWPARKDGKFRPYIKWIAVPLSLSQIVCFFNVGSFTQSETLKLVFAYVTYILFGMLYTGINVPFGSLASRITDDPDGRTLLSTFRTIGGGIGGAAPLLIARSTRQPTGAHVFIARRISAGVANRSMTCTNQFRPCANRCTPASFRCQLLRVVD